MIYFDYSANYPVKREVLEYMASTEILYIGNANSVHGLGISSHEKLNIIDSHIKEMLKLSENQEIVYTSSATESNNLAIKGIAKSYSGFGKHILVSPYEHTSVNGALATLKDQGYDIEFLKLDDKGHIDFNSLESSIRNDTILVITIFVESETGLINDVNKISEICKAHPHCHHLVDVTQGITKENIDLSSLELVSFTPHKFGGLTGTGVLIKNKSTILTPLINGGKSNTIYRAGSIPLGLIASIEKAIELSLKTKDESNEHVFKLHNHLVSELKKIKNVQINLEESNYILNISIKGLKASYVCDYLNNAGICVSQKSACSISNTPSKTIMALFSDKARALSSFRISLSDMTTFDEVDTLIDNIRRIK